LQWSADQQIPNTPGCISNPGAAVYQQKMYVLHQAPNNTAGISGGPAAVAFSL
jgi:hypothetical protein